MNKRKETEILMEIYRRAFKQATPPVDFDKLVAEAEVDENGVKQIPFDNYEIDSRVADKIIEEVMKEYKVPKWKHQSFIISYFLGCSPNTKYYGTNKD